MRKIITLVLSTCLITVAIKAQTPEEHYKKGLELYNTKNYTDALAEFVKATDAKPDYMDAWYFRGLAKFLLKDSSAWSDFTKVIELKPDHYKAYSYRGLLKFRQGDYAAAIPELNKSLDINPNYVEAYFYRGDAKMEMKDFDGALKDLDKAISLREDYVAAWYLKGLTKIFKKDYPAAIADFNKTISFNKVEYTGGAYFFIGQCELETGSKDAACKDFKKAQEAGYKNAAAAISKNCQ